MAHERTAALAAAQKNWVGGAAQVLAYPSRYTHRTAIGSACILALQGDNVIISAPALGKAGEQGKKRRVRMVECAWRKTWLAVSDCPIRGGKLKPRCKQTGQRPTAERYLDHAYRESDNKAQSVMGLDAKSTARAAKKVLKPHCGGS